MKIELSFYVTPGYGVKESGSVVRGLWFVVYGSWSMVRGLWFVVCGLWSVVRGLWYAVHHS
jgi:hypothetical protein